MCDRCDLLEAELANLKNTLGSMRTTNEIAAVRGEFGVVPAEAKLMLALYRARGAANKVQLHMLLYGDRMDGGPDPKIIDVYASKIRQNIGAGNIVTHWGVGYSLGAECRARMDRVLEPLRRAA